MYRHGFDAATGAQSCCAWGRANGWQMMGHVDALAALPADHPRFNDSLAVFQRHAGAMASLQNKSDGRWHQVLDAPTTYLETSVTAMTLYGMAIGACVCGGVGGWEGRYSCFAAAGQ